LLGGACRLQDEERKLSGPTDEEPQSKTRHSPGDHGIGLGVPRSHIVAGLRDDIRAHATIWADYAYNGDHFMRLHDSLDRLAAAQGKRR
jgi:hypothetical protein